jgi:hypothetical protein
VMLSACVVGPGAGSEGDSEPGTSAETDASASEPSGGPGGGTTPGEGSESSASSSAGEEGESSSSGEPPTPACGGGESDYPLEITSPKPIGAAPDGFDAAHRIYRAYPGIAYEIRVAAMGGNYPFTYALADAPAGMTIDAGTGEIVWEDPQQDANDITVTVIDASGSEASETWSIVVTTDGFSFVDAVAGDPGGAGTIDDPWRTLADVWTQGGVDGIVYFRSGVYTTDGIPVENAETDDERIEFYYGEQPVIWLAHPDDAERPVLDFGTRARAPGRTFR